MLFLFGVRTFSFSQLCSFQISLLCIDPLNSRYLTPRAAVTQSLLRLRERSAVSHETSAHLLQLSPSHNRRGYISTFRTPLPTIQPSTPLLQRTCTAAPVPLAERMPTTAEEGETLGGMGGAARVLGAPLVSPAHHGWVTVAPTARGAAEDVQAERGVRPSPWRTSSPSMQPTPPQDPCT